MNIPRSCKYRALDKLLSAGFITDKQIKNLKFKEVAKIEGINRQEMVAISELQDVIANCKNINPLLEYLTNEGVAK